MIINKADFNVPYKHPISENHSEISNSMIKNMDILQNTAYFRNISNSDYCNENTCFLTNARPFHTELILAQIHKHDVLEPIIKGNVKLVIDASMETHKYHIDFIYEKLIKENGINPKNILLVVSSKDYLKYIKECSLKHVTDTVNVEHFSHYEWLMKKQFVSEHRNQDMLLKYNYVSWTDDEVDFVETTSGLTKRKFNKKYINLNRRWNTHRIALLCLLYSKNLLEKGFNSFSSLPLNSHNTSGNHGTKKVDKNVWKEWFDKTMLEFSMPELNFSFEIYKKLPLYVDTNYFDFNNAYSSQNFLARYMQNSMFQVITETFYNHTNDVVCISEKTFRSIAYKQPFILVGEHNSIRYLKDLGYKSFSPFIDESYDDIIDPVKRLRYIIDEIERLCNLTENQINDYCDNLLDVVNYNYNLFRNRKNYIYRLI